MRIHRSYIVALSHIAEASRTSVRLDNGKSLPVGELYRP
ncbi:MAG: LytTR family transcriptional regulator, partial [Bacteroidales bacterium]|nr:LytTR family transcriptional regulator [Bacteroidales bacterium]